MALNNPLLYNACLAGLTGGMQQRWITQHNAADYIAFRNSAVIVAASVDAAIATYAASSSDAQLLQSIAQGVFAERYAQAQTDWSVIATSIAALFSTMQGALYPVLIPIPASGPLDIYLYPYIVREGGNLAAAISAALTENPTAETLIFPSGSYQLERQVGNFLGSDGLRSNLNFVCFGFCKITRPADKTFQAMFAWPPDTHDVTWTNLGFHLAESDVACRAIQAYNVNRWQVRGCHFVCDDVPTDQGESISIAMLGASNTIVEHCYFDHGQCGFGGLGYGCNGVIFNANTCRNVADFAVSAVTGTPLVTNLDIKNVVITNNTIHGMNGSGAIFVGSDGANFPANVVSGVVIANNTFIGTPEPGYAGSRIHIVFTSGIVTSEINISNNVMRDDADSVNTQFGIFVSNCVGPTSFTGLSIANNQIGKLGAGAGVWGIYVDTVLIDDSQIIDNVLQGNRGILVSNPVNMKIAGNQIFNSTTAAIDIRASTRNVSGIDVSKNFAEAVGSFSAGILFEVTAGAFSIQAWLDDNKMSSATGAALSFIPGAGSGSFYQTDQKFLLSTQDAAMIAATVFERDPS